MLINSSQLLYTSELSFNDIVSKLDQVGTGFILLVDADHKLIGIVTDGDVRKAVLSNSRDVQSLINRKPHFIFEKDIESADVYMRINRIRHLPVLNANNQITDIRFLNDIEYIKIDTPVVLMAGGIGSRLKPLTDNLPKPMLSISGKPLLQILIEQFKSYGFTNFHISVNYLSKKIMDHFKDGRDLNVSIQYIHEKMRMGTAGALFHVKNKITTPFLLMNSDLITDLNFKQLLDEHLLNKASVTVCTKKQSYNVPFGVIESDSDNSVLDIREKPVYSYDINGGIYAISPDVLQLLTEEKYLDMPDLMSLAKKQGLTVKKKSIHAFWSDIGTLDEYERVKNSIGGTFKI